ncbi:phosphopantetheine adenylyltransferase [Oceanococcus atlanticus]|uniref:Phosphopantetheine adenylyltransferase n=1 Tax=Oceanococcus atlanticus TaxID=1317117 RepID=A0A1Y1SA53_9GAMM|nr:pantetheine-phosphate adenylyltransferase [Oceanococcus atlanticus]ORE85223.1 phosphopantetheine adenylyltransferase [Oceanococcus atlanticus]RZO83960.1 MAG: pantetheine-phosphate adenylyltransferase [Oceanococcus sp.]
MKAAYTGTFDPITLGHTDMITRASAMFDELVVAIARSSAKNPLFTLEQRVDMAERALAHIPNVRVCGFSGLIIEFARQNGVTVLVRGVRNNTDFDYESQMARMVKHLAPEIDTIILPPTAKYAHISSTLVREIAQLGGPLTDLVPELVEEEAKSRPWES